LSICAGNKLRGTASGRDEHGCLGVKASYGAKEVAVERAAQAFVCANQNDGTLDDRAHFEQRMGKIDRLGRGPALDAIEQSGKGTAGQSGFLGLAHLGGCHHLHRFGDLGGAADRADSPAYVACAGHG